MKTKTKRKSVVKKRATKKAVLPRAFDLDAVKKFIDDNLLPGEDYGPLEGKKEGLLFKPGADKLARFFGVFPEYLLVREERLTSENIDIVTSVKLIDAKTQKVVWNSSLCSCNTMEDEYRYKWTRPICSTCAGSGSALTGDMCQVCKGKKYLLWSLPLSPEAQAEISSGMAKMVPEVAGNVTVGWQYWKRTERENLRTQWNNVRQQSSKRSFVQAIRSYGCVSKFFSEDVADWYDSRRRVDAMIHSPGVEFEASAPVQK